MTQVQTVSSQVWRMLGRIGGYISWVPVFIVARFTTRTRILVTTNNNKVLVVQGWLNTGNWLLPGGGVHRGEKPETAILRELSEETGITLEPTQVTLLGKYTQTKGFRYAYHLYSARVENELLLHPQPFEIISAQWVTRSQLQHRKIDQHISTALSHLE